MTKTINDALVLLLTDLPKDLTACTFFSLVYVHWAILKEKISNHIYLYSTLKNKDQSAAKNTNPEKTVQKQETIKT